jgi:hypothetical protein
VPVIGRLRGGETGYVRDNIAAVLAAARPWPTSG